MKETKILYFHESLTKSIISDAVTFSMLVVCIWFSGDSKLWQLVCFVMFVMFSFVKFSLYKSSAAKTFHDYASLKTYIDNQTETEKQQ